MDRDHRAGLQETGGAGRPFRVHVTGPEPRAPAPDRQQGDVEPGGQGSHVLEQIGVAGEVQPDRALHQEADGLALGPERRAPSVVHRPRRDDLHRSDPSPLARRERRHDAAVAAHDLGSGRRGQNGDLPGQPRQRRQVEVVTVRVRDEDRVGARQIADRRGDAAHVAEAPAQERIREQRDAVELDQGRGVSDIGEAAHDASLSGAAHSVRGARARRPRHAGLTTRGRHAPLDGTLPERDATRMRTVARVERVRERALELAPRVPGYAYAMVVLGRDRRHGGGLLAGALAFRLFGALLPLALLVAVLLGYAGTLDRAAPKEAGAATGISEALLASVAESSKLTAGTRWVVGLTALVALLWAAMSAARAIRAVHSIAWRGSVGRYRRPLHGALGLLAVVAACALIFGAAGRARAEYGLVGLLATVASFFGFLAVWLAAERLLPHEDSP